TPRETGEPLRKPNAIELPRTRFSTRCFRINLPPMRNSRRCSNPRKEKRCRKSWRDNPANWRTSAMADERYHVSSSKAAKEQFQRQSSQSGQMVNSHAQCEPGNG